MVVNYREYERGIPTPNPHPIYKKSSQEKICSLKPSKQSYFLGRRRSKKDNFWDRKLVNNNPFDAHLRVEQAFLVTGGAIYMCTSVSSVVEI